MKIDLYPVKTGYTNAFKGHMLFQSASEPQLDVESQHNEALRYLDTVSLRFPITLAQPGQIHGLRRTTDEKGQGYEFHKYRGTFKAVKGTTVYVRYNPRCFDKNSYLYFDFSVPKLVIGTNGREIQANIDIMKALHIELLPVFAALNIPPMDLLQGVLCRLDISMNFNVGQYKQDFLDYLSRQNYPRRGRSTHTNYSDVRAKRDGKTNGIVFASPSGKIRTSFYDKWKECRQVTRKGILRMEVSIRLPRRIEKLFGKKHPTLADLTLNQTRNVLNKDLEQLGLDRPIRSCSSNLAELIALVGATRAHNLRSFMELEQLHPGLPAKDMAEVTGYSVKTVNQKRREIKDLGIGLHVSENITLPVLTIEGMSSTPGKNGVERHSNTN